MDCSPQAWAEARANDMSPVPLQAMQAACDGNAPRIVSEIEPIGLFWLMVAAVAVAALLYLRAPFKPRRP